MMRRWNSILRQLVPTKVTDSIKRSRLYVRHRSTSVNIYHCCVHKTASQWIKAILSDSRTYRYSGLTLHTYQKTLPGCYDPRKVTDRAFVEPFPTNLIVTPLYIDFENFEAIPKPESYKAFFVMRDPRDVVVSWYFSMRYSHSPMGEIPGIREVLNSKSISDGILYSIDYLADFGEFEALRSWVHAPKSDQNVLLLRFEEITGSNNLQIIKTLFSHCDIYMPDRVLCQLLQDYSFERLSDRRRGEEDRQAHYRKGIRGDWKSYFDDRIIAKFKEATSDLVTLLGYEKDLNC